MSNRSKSRPVVLGAGLAAIALMAAACSSNSSSKSSAAGTTPSAATQSATLDLSGGHLTDATGRTVYLWLADTGSQSTCTGACASAWPPVPASGSPTVGNGLQASALSTTTRADGTTQLTYGGHPLYYFVGDKAVGNTNGQGSEAFGAKWWEVNAAGNAVSAATGSSAASSAPASSTGGYNY